VSERLPTHLIVAALLRRVNDAGGMAMVRARGDARAGTVLVLIDTPSGTRALERRIDIDGTTALIEARPTDAPEPIDDYWRRRRARDPDLWVIELDGAIGIGAAHDLLG
jgi:hypothetical protein